VGPACLGPGFAWLISCRRHLDHSLAESHRHCELGNCRQCARCETRQQPDNWTTGVSPAHQRSPSTSDAWAHKTTAPNPNHLNFPSFWLRPLRSSPSIQKLARHRDPKSLPRLAGRGESGGYGRRRPKAEP
jgi:hypothetical protein